MKIAVACDGAQFSGHFGHCAHFLFFQAENGQIVGQEDLPSPGHGHGVLPDFVADQGASVIISGGMGAGAVEAFERRAVEVITGASGDPKEAVERFLKGELKSSGVGCSHEGHGHGEGGCHGHGSCGAH